MYKIDEYKANYKFPEISTVAKESNLAEQQRDIQKIKDYVIATENYILELCKRGDYYL